MPTKYRLTVADLKTFRADRRLSGTYFSLSVGKASHVQAACVVSKKVSARAVDRNRVRRRCRAALSPLLPTLPLGAYVWYAKKEALTADYKDVRSDIVKLIDRVS